MLPHCRRRLVDEVADSRQVAALGCREGMAHSRTGMVLHHFLGFLLVCNCSRRDVMTDSYSELPHAVLSVLSSCQSRVLQ